MEACKPRYLLTMRFYGGGPQFALQNFCEAHFRECVFRYDVLWRKVLPSHKHINQPFFAKKFLFCDLRGSFSRSSLAFHWLSRYTGIYGYYCLRDRNVRSKYRWLSLACMCVLTTFFTLGSAWSEKYCWQVKISSFFRLIKYNCYSHSSAVSESA